jgi:hypothetical protein
MLTTVVIVGGTSGSWAGQKPDPTPNWPCQIVFRDAGGDAIKSDTTPGSAAWPKPYRDGVDGVTCYIVTGEGSAHYRWLYMIISSSRRSLSPRFIQFAGQAYPQLSGSTASYSSFANQDGGSFEVKGLAKVEYDPVDPTHRDVMPFRALLRGAQFVDGFAQMSGDSNFDGAVTGIPGTGNIDFDTTTSVFVQPLDACSWQITSHTTGEPFPFAGTFGERTSTRTDPRVMRIVEGIKKPRVRGDFPMPFQATISVIGNKPDCPLP